jgi:ribosome recycling factor
MINDVLQDAKSKMNSTLSVYEEDLHGIRGNRASIGLVDKLEVEYYGQATQLRQLATLSTPEPMQILIRPFDQGALKAIERAIREANLGFNPNSDGQTIRLLMPALTRERRSELVKFLKKRTEEARIAIRNIRRHSNDDLREFEKESMISEDDLERGEAEIQKMTGDYIAKIEELEAIKEKEIMEI